MVRRHRPRAKVPSSSPSPRPEPRTAKPDRGLAVAPSGARRPGNIVDYWSRLRGERPFPAPAELDPGLIAAAWPNALLLRRHDGETGLRAAAVYRPPAGPGKAGDHTLDFSPMVVEWILSLGEQALGSGQPAAEKESFERPRGAICYAACALPLGDGGGEPDHVLCYLRAMT